MYHGISARRDGLGRIFIDNSSMNTVAFSALLTAGFYMLIVIFRLYGVYGTGTITLFWVLFSVLYIFSFYQLNSVKESSAALQAIHWVQ